MKKNRGMTLLEIIIVLAVLSVAIPAVLAAFARIVATGADASSVTVAANLSEFKMEEMIRGKRFADIVSVTETGFSGQFSSYNYEIDVDYVNPSDLDTPVTGPTDFKRVRTVVTRDGMSGFNVALSTVITNLGY